MRVTAADVARAAGVSQSAVSRAFTDGASVAPETRARILAFATQLGYRPNRIARGLTGQKTGLVGLVIGAVSSPYEAVLLDVLSRTVRSHGRWPLLVRATSGDEIDRGLEEVLAYQVDGVVVAAGSVSRAVAERSTASGAPLVMIGRILEDVRTDAVCCDNAAGMTALVDRIAASGRRRFGWIGGRADTFSNVERRAGLVAALAARGLDLHAEGRGDYSVESGLTQGLALMTRPDPPDAILCGNDAMALGALDAARRLGIAVPEKTAVAGFDDIPAAAWEPYRLTTVRNPVEATAEKAVALLLHRIAEPDGPAVTLRVTPELVTRATA